MPQCSSSIYSRSVLKSLCHLQTFVYGRLAKILTRQFKVFIELILMSVNITYSKQEADWLSDSIAVLQ